MFDASFQILGDKLLLSIICSTTNIIFLPTTLLFNICSKIVVKILLTYHSSLYKPNNKDKYRGLDYRHISINRSFKRRWGRVLLIFEIHDNEREKGSQRKQMELFLPTPLQVVGCNINCTLI